MERHPSFGPIPHTSIQGANTTGFRAQRRTVNHRSAPYSIVNRQERNRGTIYNGNVYGGVNSFTISNNEGAILQYLKEHAATGAMHDSDQRFPPPLCHPGTREAVIHRIFDWYGYQHGPGKPIMWVYAPAGYGKTAVAGTVAEILEKKQTQLGFNPLGATFFFWRTSAERSSPARFIVTLTYQLFVSIPGLAPHIENAIKQNPMILTKALEVQMKKLIVEPFKALGDTTAMPNRLVIVDGLDECINSDRESRIDKKYAEDQERVQIRVLNLLRDLASHSLPLSLLILSRPESWIKQHVESRQFKDLVEFVDLYEVGDHMQDVETFVKAKLSQLELDEEDLVKSLVAKAGGHMLYASTVILHIDDPYGDPRARLQNILSNSSNSNPDLAHSTPFSSLHELYRQIMRSCPSGSRSCMIEVLEDIEVADGFNGRSITMRRALDILDALSDRAPGSGMRAIRGLNGVLNMNGKTKAPVFQFFIHSSFSEFLLDARLSQEFHVDRQKGYRRHLLGCLNKISSISLKSSMEEEHLQYAVLEEVVYDADLNASTASEGYANPIIPSQLMYDSVPLAQQALSHVRASSEAAVIHILDASNFDNPDNYNTSFYVSMFQCMDDLMPGEVPLEVWNANQVACALRRLKQRSPEGFDTVIEELRECVEYAIDNLEADMEAFEAFIVLI
ncbi:hypothetical protein MD484_g7449, partial [Candolleomyces efflorescens]